MSPSLPTAPILSGRPGGRRVSFDIEAGDFVAPEGPSGAGKTTLLQLLGALARPSEGVVAFERRDLATLRDNELAHLRLSAFGFVQPRLGNRRP